MKRSYLRPATRPPQSTYASNPTGGGTLRAADRLRQAMRDEAKLLRAMGMVHAATDLDYMAGILPLASLERIARNA